MIQQFLNMFMTLFLARFMLNDVPHMLDEEWLKVYRRRHPNIIDGIIQEGVIPTEKAVDGAKCVEAKLRSEFGDELIKRVVVIGSFAYGKQMKKDARGAVANISSDIDDAEKWDRITPGKAEGWRQALGRLTLSAVNKVPYELAVSPEPVNISLEQVENAFGWDKDLLKTALYSFYSDVDIRIICSGETPAEMVDATDRIVDQCFWEITYPHVISYEWVRA